MWWSSIFCKYNTAILVPLRLMIFPRVSVNDPSNSIRRQMFYRKIGSWICECVHAYVALDSRPMEIACRTHRTGIFALMSEFPCVFLDCKRVETVSCICHMLWISHSYHHHPYPYPVQTRQTFHDIHSNETLTGAAFQMFHHSWDIATLLGRNGTGLCASSNYYLEYIVFCIFYTRNTQDWHF